MAQKVVVDFELKYKEAVKNLNEFQKEYAKLEKEVVKANEETAKSIKAVEKASEESAKGIKKVGLTIGNLAKASGIVFLLKQAFEFVSGAIRENQEVMDGLNLVFETAQIVFNQVLGAITDIYKAVTQTTDNFDALGKVLSGILTLSLTPIKFSFYAIKLGIQEAMLAWEDSFFGGKDADKIKQLNKDILETKTNIVGIAEDAKNAGKDVVDNFSEAVGEVGAIGDTIVKEFSEVSVKTASETAKSNLALKKSAEIAVAQSRIVLEQKDKEAEKLRQVRDEERNSIADRIKANNDLNTVLDEQEKEMTKNANAVLAAAQAQFKLTKKDEDYVKVLEAEAEKKGVLAQIEGFRSEQKSNDLALNKELLELSNSQLESDANLLIEKKRFNAETIEDNLARLEAQKLIDEEEKVLQEARLQSIVDEATAGTQAKVDAQIALDEFLEQSRQQNIERDREILAEETAITEAKKSLQLQLASAVGNALGKISQLFEQGTAASKAAALAEIVIGTGVGLIQGLDIAQKSAKGTGPAAAFAFPIFYATQIAAVLGAVGQAKSILSTVKGGGGGGSTPRPTAPQTSSPQESIPPAFNIVGASETNQLADAIGGQAQEPTRAYVVATDVSTAQELDRNIIEGASI